MYPIIGLDISKSKIGFATIDGENLLPRPLFTMERGTRKRDLEKCVEYLQKFNAKTVVIGLPLERDGTLGERAVWVRRIARDIKHMIAPDVYLVDERYTTVEAKEYLLDGERNADVDAVAAVNILKRFIENKREGNIEAI